MMFKSKKIISFFLGATLFLQSGFMYSAFADGGSVAVPNMENSKKVPSEGRRKDARVDRKNEIKKVAKVGGSGALAGLSLYALWYKFFRNDVTRPAHPLETPNIPRLSDFYSSSNTDLIEKTANFTGFLEMCRGKVNDRENIDVAELDGICDAVTPLLERKPSVVGVSGRTMIVGDIYGNFAAAEHCCNEFLRELEKTNGNTSIVFLGDYVDRGQNSVECMALIFKLKILFPDKVCLLRGNHEDKNVNVQYGFWAECRAKYGEEFLPQTWNAFNNVFVHLPVAAVIDNSAFCAHGGIPTRGQQDNGGPATLLQICGVRKVGIVGTGNDTGGHRTEIDDNMFMVVNLLWNDPVDVDAQFSNGYNRGCRCAYRFGRSAVAEFLEKNGRDRIVRAHEFAEQGYEELFEGRCVTVFSSPNYRGNGSNRGATMIVDGATEPEYRQFG